MYMICCMILLNNPEPLKKDTTMRMSAVAIAMTTALFLALTGPSLASTSHASLLWEQDCGPLNIQHSIVGNESETIPMLSVRWGEDLVGVIYDFGYQSLVMSVQGDRLESSSSLWNRRGLSRDFKTSLRKMGGKTAVDDTKACFVDLANWFRERGTPA